MGKALSKRNRKFKSILLCGAESTGKTLFIKKIQNYIEKQDEGDHQQEELNPQKTNSLDRVEIIHDKKKYVFWDIGGSPNLRFLREEVYNSIKVHTIVYMIKVTQERFDEGALRDLKFLINEYQLYNTDFAIVFNIFSHKYSPLDKRIDLVGDMSLNFFCQRDIEVTEEFKGYFNEKLGPILDFLNERSFKFFLIRADDLGKPRPGEDQDTSKRYEDLREISDWILFDNRAQFKKIISQNRSFLNNLERYSGRNQQCLNIHALFYHNIEY